MREILENLRKVEGWDKSDVIIVIHAERGMLPHLEEALNKLGLADNAVELQPSIGEEECK